MNELIFNLMVELTTYGIQPKMCRDFENILYIDLDTYAKSHLYLYLDGKIVGRYEYTYQLDLSKSINDLLVDLGEEFKKSTHGRGGNDAWFNLCQQLGINI
ncbi:hypothetical protein BPT24_200 [Tenacibaculum phage pT24]|uniref:Uncharacterized protein n=1 Tax=Tenacibaculum phage pT24 TaxID=1880590 RepID=A0A1B4XWZ3_9CAUD|nr:hypothetical protein HYP10_gp200 [Tenacibaculum phage pT24]BAV39324.1 hypothetical protein BPT24_200 [Tenacibaculum phage pT24]